ncbi:class I SAM-dependent methyltransferase [Altererythrobacter sp. H2]|uniref:class I SAM-dependent methyltransferase n=1 Tax=Altererythrobacter sp. H2 TaxID=3108391 RepID=UPI002B4BAA69|nr:class I SAM-dependent methyltransferase [Altererythrobacter sp. H2]WRK96840.1 class I SAM-dependent methyltransferase [Altererythrobacter sp. H2]
MAEDREQHWDEVYRERPPERLSWHQDSPGPSLDALARFGAESGQSLIDIGGGISGLVDALLERGWRDITVLDISEAALQAAQTRLGDRAGAVHWEVADITLWVPSRSYDVWHDRAVFHFLTEPALRAAYVNALEHGLTRGGLLVMATFALDGPEKCSGLPVQRYDAETLGRELGPSLHLIDEWRDDHTTPWGDRQSFQWCVFRKD